MEKATVIKLRELCYKATFTLYNKNKDCDPDKRTLTLRGPVHIVCDNSLNIVDNPLRKSVIWDDANECLYYFTYNTESSFFNPATTAISFGDKPAVPGLCILVDYGEIQNIRVQLNEEAFDNLAKSINGMTDEDKKAIKNYIFKETDQREIIKRKKNISYNTITDKRTDPGSRRYDDNHEYNRTIHPVAY